MALVKKTQRSFAGGMLDKDLMGRQDLNKYSQGCLDLTNFKVRKQGNIIKRSGTDLVADFSKILWSYDSETSTMTETSVATAKILPIIQEREAGFYLLLSGQKAFLVGPQGVKMTDDTWSRSPQPQTTSPYGKPYSISTPFNDADLGMLDWCQSGDVVFFAHRSYPPCKISYDSGTLTYEKLQFRQSQGVAPVISSVAATGEWTSTGGTKEIEYCVTAVKDGIESAPSVAYAVQYRLPWPDSCGFKITIDTSNLDDDDYDCFYIYKKVSDVFGLIGTTSNNTTFVDVSDDFNIGSSSTNYPSGFTTFDKQVHLRESGNEFASVSIITSTSKKSETSSCEANSSKANAYNSGEYEYSAFQAWKTSHTYSSRTTTTGSSTTRSSTAQKYNSVSSSSEYVIRLTATDTGALISKFKFRIGSIVHNISQESTIFSIVKYYYSAKGGVTNTYYLNNTPTTVSSSSTTKWTGTSSDFTPCPAKFFKARVQYWSGSTLTYSAWFDCNAVVDQSDPGDDWSAIAGSSGMYRRTYSDSDYMISYDSAAAVIARMDAKAPAVGSIVTFDIPSAYVGKKILRIQLAGYTDSTAATGADLLVNGFSCYQAGKYVNTFTDEYITPDLTITPPKTEDHFVNPGEYPGCVQIYQQRLVYGASADNPFTFWMSCTGDLTNFDEHEYVRASDAITASTAALEMPRINRMLVHRDLMLFSDGGEWQVAPVSGNSISPSTIAAKLQSIIGCASWIKPIPMANDIIFCDSAGEALYATRYNFASDGYEASNLSVLSQRLFRNNAIVAMAYAQFPESTIECVLSDGAIASLVYMQEHEVCAWSRQVLGGDWFAFDVSANKSIVNGSSECVFLARRTYDDSEDNAVTEWAVLGLRDIDPNNSSLEGNLRMDAITTHTSEPTAGHGETVVRIGASKWAKGCCFTSSLKTTSPEFTDQETAQMEIKNATESEVRVIDGSDFTVRQSGIAAAQATAMAVACPVDATSTVYTVAPGDADVKLPLTGNNAWSGSIIVEHGGYLPLAILSVTTAYRVEYANHGGGGKGEE